VLLAKTIETTGFVNHQHQLSLDESLPLAETSRVRVIVIVTEEKQLTQSETIFVRDQSVGIGKNKKLNHLPDIFYAPINRSQYKKFNREEIYNG
jgi:hypothetical protein